MRVVGVVGPKNSGKTTLICDVLKVLKKRGIEVATVKHSGHPVEMDREGTDTYRFKKYTNISVFSDVRGETTFFYRSMGLEEILSKLDSDLVIVEGFKEKLRELNIPKIVTVRDGKGREFVDSHTIMVVENMEYEVEDVVREILNKSVIPTYNLNCGHCGYNCKEFVERLIRGELNWKDCVLSTDVELVVNGKTIPLNPFVSKIIKNTVVGLVSSLKGVEDTRDISIRIKR
ncbi:MAG TPA: molybdopterin-guanine dinucleotide biosynthesis protein B [Methanothermococcus okinawensis]|nr:molybdopterin-guanine dinucleotide biosynthesis protein B [Methanothermococcus okinawensis]HIP34741.1 molybdopterin-guanine dinucleotide biosynthesis protein B [Methanothermococcus okinawensis]